MSGLLYFLIGLILLIIISFLSNLQLEVKVEVDNKINYSYFILRFFWGLICIRFNYTLTSLEKGVISLVSRKTDSNIEKHATIEDILRFFLKKHKTYLMYEDEFGHIISRTTIQNLDADIIIGLGDAAQTALLSGSIMAGFGYLKKRFGLKASRIKVSPYFNEVKFEMVLDCIFNVKLGHIIIIGIRMLLHGIKGGEISGRTSN